MAKKAKKKLSDLQRKSVWTFFTLLFPSLILGLIVAGLGSPGIIGILLFFYQAILLKNFVENHYKAEF